MTEQVYCLQSTSVLMLHPFEWTDQANNCTVSTLKLATQAQNQLHIPSFSKKLNLLHTDTIFIQVISSEMSI